jgi:hypothetical protein
LEAADKQKMAIMTQLQGKLLYLKLDCATRLRTNYLGISARCVNDDNEPTTVTLMVTDIKARHTSQELKIHLDKALSEFSIEWSQVLCCITDNASNMMSLGKESNEDLSQPETKDDDDDDDSGTEVAA